MKPIAPCLQVYISTFEWSKRATLPTKSPLYLWQVCTESKCASNGTSFGRFGASRIQKSLNFMYFMCFYRSPDPQTVSIYL